MQSDSTEGKEKREKKKRGKKEETVLVFSFPLSLFSFPLPTIRIMRKEKRRPNSEELGRRLMFDQAFWSTQEAGKLPLNYRSRLGHRS